MKMLLEIENQKPTHVKDFGKIEKALRGMKKLGPYSFVILTAQDGSYLQVAGWDKTCVIELRDHNSGKHYRGYSKQARGAQTMRHTLGLGGGNLTVASDEVFELDQVVAAFSAFFERRDFSEELAWRDMSQMFS